MFTVDLNVEHTKTKRDTSGSDKIISSTESAKNKIAPVIETSDISNIYCDFLGLDAKILLGTVKDTISEAELKEICTNTPVVDTSTKMPNNDNGLKSLLSTSVETSSIPANKNDTGLNTTLPPILDYEDGLKSTETPSIPANKNDTELNTTLPPINISTTTTLKPMIKKSPDDTDNTTPNTNSTLSNTIASSTTPTIAIKSDEKSDVKNNRKSSMEHVSTTESTDSSPSKSTIISGPFRIMTTNSKYQNRLEGTTTPKTRSTDSSSSLITSTTKVDDTTTEKDDKAINTVVKHYNLDFRNNDEKFYINIYALG